MINNLKYYFFFIGLTVIFSCVGDDLAEDLEKNVEVQFITTYGENPAVMFTKYPYPSGDSILFNRFSFYLSDLTIKGDSAEVLIPVDYLNFTNQNTTPSSAADGIKYTFKTKQSNLQEISFGIGVGAEENAKDPTSYDAASPLSRVAEYWPGWASFVFAKIEGQFIKNQIEPALNFALHTGSDDAYFEKKAASLNYTMNENVQIIIRIDLQKVFGIDNIYDIEKNPGLHSLSQKPQVLEISNNLKSAITISLN